MSPKYLIVLVALLVIVTSGCTKREVGKLKFTTVIQEWKEPSVALDKEHRVGAYYWSDFVTSVSFTTFVEASFPAEKSTLIKRGRLRPQTNDVASVVLPSGPPDEEKIAAKVFAEAIQAYANDQMRKRFDEECMRLREQIAKNPSNRAQLEWRLRNAEIGPTITVGVTWVIDPK